MSKKSLTIIALSAVLIMVLVGGILFFMQYKSRQNMQGKLVFAATYDQGSKVNKIVVVSSEGTTELEQKNSYWLVKNHGNYYADFGLVHRFLTSVNQSVYVIRLPYLEKTAKDKYLLNPLDNKEDSGLLIRTYAGDKMLDEIIVGLPDDEERYFFARQPDEKDIWLIDGDFNIPLTAKDWLLRPILSIPQKAVESITIGKNYAQRMTPDGKFYGAHGGFADVDALQNVLLGIRAINVMSAEDFQKSEWQKTQEKVIDVVTFYGLEFIFKLYTRNDRYWLQINLSTTSLPMSSVNDYIRDNRFLYEGWFFELSSEQGRLMSYFNLM